ncbi:MAG: YdcF family protein, partial [Gammaproteobacteria bacterium]|nr:YdcF family protein [Gammaproteobacteria bacterium]
RFAATLHKRTGLPLLVSGGKTNTRKQKSEAQLMSEILLQDYGIKPRWIEGDSRSTAENAIYSHSILTADGVDKVLLVTHAMHMRRAELVFGRQGFAVKPAPTIFRSAGDWSWGDWFPSSAALSVTRYALHEHIGFVWYLLRS